MEVCGQLHASAVLFLGKHPHYPGWAQNGYFGEQKNLIPHLGLKPLFVSHLACNMITILTRVFLKLVCIFQCGLCL